MQHVDQFLATYGYFALFGLLMFGIVGPLIPDETILVLAGIAVHRGELRPVPTFAVAFAGSLCGITVSYFIGRTGALYALHRFPLVQRRIGDHLPEVQRWFERFGKWTLFFGYFVAGARHVTALVAGMSGLRTGMFALYAYPGGFIWVGCFLAMGYFLGQEWERLAHRLDTVAIVLAGIVAAVSLVWWYAKRKTRDAAPPS